MIQETYEKIEIDRCPTCKGILLDSGELKSLISKKIGNKVDTLNFSSTSDTMDNMPSYCFHCNKDMQVMSAIGNIRIERCPNCKSIFLDQGELASLQLYSK
jgi:Zn-finger nucleic acid-binding protein